MKATVIIMMMGLLVLMPRGTKRARVFLNSTLYERTAQDLNQIIRSVVEEEGFTCVLPQEILPPGPLADPVRVLRLNARLVRTCDIVLSVLDSPGEGVFFELGAAHALGKPIIAYRTLTNRSLGKVVEGLWLTLPRTRRASNLGELRASLRKLRDNGGG